MNILWDIHIQNNRAHNGEKDKQILPENAITFLFACWLFLFSVVFSPASVVECSNSSAYMLLF